jgi:hypothetical protein
MYVGTVDIPWLLSMHVNTDIKLIPFLGANSSTYFLSSVTSTLWQQSIYSVRLSGVHLSIVCIIYLQHSSVYEYITHLSTYNIQLSTLSRLSVYLRHQSVCSICLSIASVFPQYSSVVITVPMYVRSPIYSLHLSKACTCFYSIRLSHVSIFLKSQSIYSLHLSSVPIYSFPST